MPFEAALTELPKMPVYQAIAEQAAHLHLLGMNPNRIARSPWRRPNNRNQSTALYQVVLTRNVKADSVRQQWPFPHPVVPVIPVFRGRFHLGQTQENGKIHQSAPGVA